MVYAGVPERSKGVDSEILWRRPTRVRIPSPALILSFLFRKYIHNPKLVWNGIMKNEVIKKMIEYFQTDVKKINHALKVYNFAQSLFILKNGIILSVYTKKSNITYLRCRIQ